MSSVAIRSTNVKLILRMLYAAFFRHQLVVFPRQLSHDHQIGIVVDIHRVIAHTTFNHVLL